MKRNECGMTHTKVMGYHQQYGEGSHAYVASILDDW